MKSHRSLRILPVLFLAAGLMTLDQSAQADTVKLKDGKSIEGRITFEGTDFIKVEVPVSASIKETRTIVRSDIAEIIKQAPDDVALDALRKQLPAPSMMTADAYRAMIERGPKAFLTQFPSSRHKTEVEKILADLSGELDKVERGGVKLEGEWISAQERKQFAALTESRIRLVAMKFKIAQGDLLGALRDFEVLEEQYYGTPAFASAVAEAKALIPAFGQRLQRVLADVGYRNQKWEQDKAVLDEVARAQVEAARAQEMARFAKAIETEKAAGIKWQSINENSEESLTATITLARAELDRLNAMDLAALGKLADDLVAADKLIAEGKLDEAREAIKAATGTALPKSSGSTKKSGGSSSRSRSSKGGAQSKTSYPVALNEKIAEMERAKAEAAQQAENAAAGAKIASTIKGGEGGAPAPAAPDGEAPKADGASPAGEGEKGAAMEKGKGGDQASALTGLMAGGSSDAKKAEGGAAKAGGEPKKSSGKKPKVSAKNTGEDEPEGGASAEAADEGGGLSMQHYLFIGTGVLILVVVLLKVLGVGSKKE